MLSETMHKTLNNQVTMEHYSAYVYFGLACDFAKMGLMGFAHWLIQQWREESSHALDFATYIVDRGHEVTPGDVLASTIEWECPCEAMKKALEHEQMIETRINEILRLARKDNDYATEQFAMKYVGEQTEEIATLNAIVGKLEMIGEDSAGLIHVDNRLAEREPR